MSTTALILALGFAPLAADGPTRDATSGWFPLSQDPVAQDSAAGPQRPPGIPAEVADALGISEALMVLRDSIEAVLPGQDTLSGPQRQVLTSRVRGWLGDAAELQRSLVDLQPELAALTAPSESGPPDSLAPEPAPRGEAESSAVGEALAVVRSRLVDYAQWMRVAYDDQRTRQNAALDSLNAARADASSDRLAAIDSESRLRRGQVDTLFSGEAEFLANSQALGIDVADGWRALEQAALARADGLTGRLRLAQLEEARLNQELEDAERAGLSDAETARIRNEIRVLDRLIGDLSATLAVTSDFLDGRGYETAAYRQLAIQATGEVTGDILDWDVFAGLVGQAVADAVSWVRVNGPTFLVRLLIVLGCIFLGRLGVRVVWWLFRTVRLVRLPRLATQLIGRLLRPVGTILGLGFGLWAIGADATTMLAGAGVAGVVLGFALQDSLANFASGFMLLFYRPFDQDDTIEAAGVVGTVRSMGLANTTLVTFDNRRVSIPNSKLWGTVIANRSSEPTRRAEAVLRVGFDQDLNQVSEIVLQRLRGHPMVLKEPGPSCYVSGAGDSWMELTVWAWTSNADWWTVTAAMPALLKAVLEEQGIPIPLPTQKLVGPAARAGTLA